VSLFKLLTFKYVVQVISDDINWDIHIFIFLNQLKTSEDFIERNSNNDLVVSSAQ
jgi:hypothetical protein